MNWSPIETAPKDGTEIILYLPRAENNSKKSGKITTGYWYPESPVFKQAAHWQWDGCWADQLTYAELTHWMKRPDAPEVL